MVGQEMYGVQRRALDIEDYIDIARRHKGWIFGPAFAAVVVSVVGAYLWPDTYVSSASIRVLPQQVPTSYVQANVNQQMQDRVMSLAEEILSRPVLTGLINSHQLYRKQLERKPMDDVVEDMRRDISIGQVASIARPAGPGQNTTMPAFRISFSYTDRNKAQAVVQDLASRFIDENLRNRNRDSLRTTELLRSTWEEARKNLEATEAKLAEFRARNQGRLPDQVQGNLQQLNAAQSRLTSLNEALSRSNSERMQLEGLLRIYKEEMQASKEPRTQRAVVERRNARLDDAEKEIRQLEVILAAQRERWKDTHPDVQQTVALLAAAKKRRDAALKDDDSKKPEVAEDPGLTPVEAREMRAVEQNYKRIETQIAAKDLEAADIRKEMANVNNYMRGFEARLQGAPLSEKEYTELLRDRDTAREKFLDIDTKLGKSSLAQQMEDRRAGESLELLERASLPMTPVKPDRLMIIGIGAGVGLMLGIGLAGAREVKDTSLKNLKDVRAYTQLSVLGSIPLLENDLVIRRRRRLTWLGWAVACLAGIVVMSSSVIYYYATRV